MTTSETPVPETPKKRKVRVGSRVGSGSVSNYVCITKGADVKRANRKLADAMVKQEGWAYCLRSKWKSQFANDNRGVSVTTEDPKPKAKKVKPRKGKESK